MLEEKNDSQPEESLDTTETSSDESGSSDSSDVLGVYVDTEKVASATLSLWNARLMTDGKSKSSSPTASLRNVNLDSNNEIETFERVLSEWYNAFYDSNGCRRRLRASISFADMTFKQVNVTGQKLMYDSYGVPIKVMPNKVIPKNVISFNMAILFHDRRRLSGCYLPSRNVNVNDLTPEEIAIAPFEDEDANNELVAKLRKYVDALHDVKAPIEAPTFPNQAHTDDADEVQTDDSVSTMMLVALIAGAGAALVCMMLFFLVNKNETRKRIDSH